MTSIFSDYALILKVIFKNILKINITNELNFTLVTASDEKHFFYLKNLIKNYELKGKKYFIKFIIFDLGLSKVQLTELYNNKVIEVRKFPFEEYPEFFSSRAYDHKNKLGGFAWKPEIINILRKEHINQIIWLDSACLFTSKILLFQLLIKDLGVASFNSSGSISQWTYSTVLDELIHHNDINILNSSNLLAGVIGFDFANNLANNLHENWNELCSQEKFILPKGSNSSNHRHDQSLLSISYWKIYKNKLPNKTNNFGIRIQNWPNKTLYFFDERDGLREKLLKKYYFDSTTTNTRSKIIILFNVHSLKQIPLRLIFNKTILLFVANQEEVAQLKHYFFKSKFVKLFHNTKGNIESSYLEIDEIIEKEYILTQNNE
jgi:hypothetical protein